MKKQYVLGTALFAVVVLSVGYMHSQSSTLNKRGESSLHAGIGGTWSADMGATALGNNQNRIKNLIHDGRLSLNELNQVKAQLLSQAIINAMTADGRLSDSALSGALEQLESEGMISIAK